MMRQLAIQSQALLRRVAADGLACSGLSAAQARAAFSTLPEDLAAAASRAKWPVRRTVPAAAAGGSVAAAAAAAAETPAATGAAAAVAAATGTAAAANEAAAKQVQAGSPWMFPWERRQLQGGDLRWWEKAYWGVFVVGIALILFNRIEWEKAPDPKEEERKQQREAARLEAARLVLAGKSILVPWGTDDPFAGMSPKEIEEYCGKVTGGASTDDPFEGMTPQEIDEYIERHGLPAGAQL
ncbi:hypothetical protein ABPG77_007816 [Micractinium sp. CCAP 211/92]